MFKNASSVLQQNWQYQLHQAAPTCSWQGLHLWHCPACGGGGLAVLVALARAPALVAPRACSAEAPGLPGGPGAGEITIKNLCSTSCRNPKRKLRRSIAGSQSAARNGSRMGVYMSWVSYIYVCVYIYIYTPLSFIYLHNLFISCQKSLPSNYFGGTGWCVLWWVFLFVFLVS